MLSQTAFNWVFFRQFDQNVLIKAYAYLMMMNCFCGMVDRRKTFILISSWDCCRRSSPSRTSDTTPAEFEPAQNLSSATVPFRSRKIQSWKKIISNYLKYNLNLRLKVFFFIFLIDQSFIT